MTPARTGSTTSSSAPSWRCVPRSPPTATRRGRFPGTTCASRVGAPLSASSSAALMEERMVTPRGTIGFVRAAATRGRATRGLRAWRDYLKRLPASASRRFWEAVIELRGGGAPSGHEAAADARGPQASLRPTLRLFAQHPRGGGARTSSTSSTWSPTPIAEAGATCSSTLLSPASCRRAGPPCSPPAHAPHWNRRRQRSHAAGHRAVSMDCARRRPTRRRSASGGDRPAARPARRQRRSSSVRQTEIVRRARYSAPTPTRAGCAKSRRGAAGAAPVPARASRWRWA